MEELWALARRDGSKADREAARARLAEIVKVRHHTMYTYPYPPYPTLPKRHNAQILSQSQYAYFKIERQCSTTTRWLEGERQQVRCLCRSEAGHHLRVWLGARLCRAYQCKTAAGPQQTE